MIYYCKFILFRPPHVSQRRLCPPLPDPPHTVALAPSTLITLRDSRGRDSGRENRQAEKNYCEKNLYLKNLFIFPSSLCLSLSHKTRRSPSPCSYQNWKKKNTDWSCNDDTSLSSHWLQLFMLNAFVIFTCFLFFSPTHSFCGHDTTVYLGQQKKKKKSSILSETFCYIIYTCI